jgi:hypothetical protein
MTETLDLTTYNPSCLHYDDYLGVCGHPEGRLMACRERRCPLDKVTDDMLNVLFKGE